MRLAIVKGASAFIALVALFFNISNIHNQMITRLLENQIPVIYNGHLYENILGDVCILMDAKEGSLVYRRLTQKEWDQVVSNFTRSLKNADVMCFQEILKNRYTEHKDAFIKHTFN